MPKIVTPEFRLSYPAVFQPKLNKLNNKMEYSVEALFPKSADLSAMKAAAKEAIVEVFGADPAQWPKNLRTPFKDQKDKAYIDEVTGKTVQPAGTEVGAIFLNFKSERKPGAVDAQNHDIIDPSELYAGCIARAAVFAKAYNKGGNCGVTFWLNHIQKVREGDPLGSKTRPQDEFSPIADAGAGDGGGGATATSLFD